MLTITNGNNCEPLTKFQNAEINEEVNGEFMLSFTSILHVENYGHSLIEEEAIVEHDGHEFKIVDINENQYSKSVTAIHTFFNLGKKWKYTINGGTKTVSDVANWLLEGTGWTWEVQGTIPPQVLENFGNGNVVNLIRHMCKELKCEVKIMPNNHLVFAQQIGTDNDFQFRFKYNTKTLQRSVNTNDLATVVKGNGANGLEVIYTSPNASIYGELEAEPISDERFTSAESLTNYIKEQLMDAPEVTIDIELTELQKDSFELGETVWVIYEPMNIEFQTRIMKYKKFPFSRKSPVVTLSTVPKIFTDQLVTQQVEIDESKREFRSRFDQTNELITLEVERLDAGIVEAYSRVEVGDERVTLEVGRIDGELGTLQSDINVLSESITLQVSQLEDDLSSLESTVSIQAGEISSKVEQSDFTGNKIASLINQTATTITLDASRINLDGITRVNKILYIGEAGSNAENKSLVFNNYAGLETYAGTNSLEVTAFGNIYLGGDEIRFDKYNGGTGAHINLSTARSINWGSHAPNTTAKFG